MTSFNLSYFQKASSPNIITLDVRASTCEFGREDTIQCIAPRKALRTVPCMSSVLSGRSCFVL